MFSVDDGDTTIGFAAWQALGHDAGSQTIADAGALAALFVDLPGGDLHLAPDSAALDAGEPRPDVPADLDGIPRPQDAGWDAGAYEALELVFADGLESGDTSAWSSTAGYSARRVVAGSTPAARRAGSRQAASATASMVAETVAKARGSVGRTS